MKGKRPEKLETQGKLLGLGQSNMKNLRAPRKSVVPLSFGLKYPEGAKRLWFHHCRVKERDSLDPEQHAAYTQILNNPNSNRKPKPQIA